MKKLSIATMLITFGGLLLYGPLAVDVLADGTETLGPPSIPITSGSGIVSAGTGLLTQPGMIDLEVPTGAAIKQVLLYWECQFFNSAGADADNTIAVNSTEITGALIGGPAFFFNNVHSASFRADITGLGLIGPGMNVLTVSGLSCGFANNGAGVMVIFDDGSSNKIEVRDGIDLAFFGFSEPRQNTIPQTFNFPSSSIDRDVTLNLFFSSVAGNASGFGDERPNRIDVTVAGVTTSFINPLDSNDGEEWDTFITPVSVPAGVTSLTVQAFSTNSTNPLGASLAWIAAGLSAPLPPPGDQGCTPGYWKNHLDAWLPTGFSPSQSVASVFNAATTFPDLGSATLLKALQFGGGSGVDGAAKILLRAAVSSLLNAAHPDVAFPRAAAQVIDDVNAAITSGNRSTMLSLATELDTDNNGGCPLN